jgi:hypothetical protein
MSSKSTSKNLAYNSVLNMVSKDFKFDVFICHASEDKTSFVEPLARALLVAGIRVWYDRFALDWGEDLRSSIDTGLRDCRFGVVVFSKAFLSKKKWTDYELSGLFARETATEKLILPIWHGVTREDFLQYSPSLADRLAKNSQNDSIEEIVDALKQKLAAPSLGDSQKARKLPDPDAYAASVVQIGGIGSRVFTRNAWLLSEHAYINAERYALVGFNGGGDIMSLSCPAGFAIVQGSSPSGNPILDELGFPAGCRILLDDTKIKNEILIECRRVGA